MEAAPGELPPLEKWQSDFSRAFQYYLDRSTPHTAGRWLETLVVAAIYAVRIYYVQGFYIITFGLGIYLLNRLIGFLSRLEMTDGLSLPTRGSDEFKPFIRRLPEFKFWLGIHDNAVAVFNGTSTAIQLPSSTGQPQPSHTATHPRPPCYQPRMPFSSPLPSPLSLIAASASLSLP